MYLLNLQCAFKLLANVEPESNKSLVLDTKYGWTLRLRNDNMTPTVSDQSDKYIHTWYNHKRKFGFIWACLLLFLSFVSAMFCVNCTHRWANLASTTWVSLWRSHRRTAGESVPSRRQKNLSIFSCVRIKPSNNNNKIFNNVECKTEKSI